MDRAYFKTYQTDTSHFFHSSYFGIFQYTYSEANNNFIKKVISGIVWVLTSEKRHYTGRKLFIKGEEECHFFWGRGAAL